MSKRVKIEYEYTYNQFIQPPIEISFDYRKVDFSKDSNPDKYVIAGNMELEVFGDLDVLVNVRGVTGFEWTLDLKVDGNALPGGTITGKINKKGVCIFVKSYKLS